MIGGGRGFGSRALGWLVTWGFIFLCPLGLSILRDSGCGASRIRFCLFGDLGWCLGSGSDPWSRGGSGLRVWFHCILECTKNLASCIFLDFGYVYTGSDRFRFVWDRIHSVYTGPVRN